MPPSLSCQAGDAYDALAPAYDLLTDGYRYEEWLGELEKLATAHGLRGRALLDVACGTGESFLPMRARGYDVVGCDLSRQMLALARRKTPDVPLHHGDMRHLPAFGSFDLVTCIDDAINYILDERELASTLRGFARNLAPDGIAVWDVNTLAQYRGQFASDRVVASDETLIRWHGDAASREIQANDVAEVVIEVFARGRAGIDIRTMSVHRQRHWPRATLERLCQGAGLDVVDIRGQLPGAVLHNELDELIHTKAIYVARKARKGGSSGNRAALMPLARPGLGSFQRDHRGPERAPPKSLRRTPSVGLQVMTRQAPIKHINDPRWVRAIAHPLRIRLLAMLYEQPLSPVALANRLEQPLGTVSYHVRTLYDLGLLELVRTRQRRGATEHFYRARGWPRFSDQTWAQLDTVAKQRMITAALEQIHEYASRSAAVGGFDPPDAHFTRTPLKLDRQGWTKLAKATKKWLDEAARIEQAAANRLAKDPHGAADVGLVILLFEALPFSAEAPSDKPAKGRPSRASSKAGPQRLRRRRAPAKPT